jgi:hypothetical protein
MAIKGIGFQEAVTFWGTFRGTAASVAAPTPKPPAVEQPVASENPPFTASYAKYVVPSDWLADRGIEAKTLERFGVGEYSNPAGSVYKGKISIFVRRWRTPSW